MKKTELMVHGHSCCEIKGENYSLICDPWLVGSAYWRSWFNFPENPNYESLIRRWSTQRYVYFYITHLHWDHFHGPSLRKIIKNCPNNYKFLIPKTPEKRLKLDLESIVGKNKVTELTHCKKYKLADQVSILSFQTGPFFADSILSVFSKDFCLLNINDAKIFKLSMNHLLSKIPKPNFVLRSHSSANSRCCFRELDGTNRNYKFDKTRLDYSKEFFDVCYETKTEYAIPFASNMACLHKETFQYNSILNFSDFVVNDFKKLSHNYKNMKCKLILPTEKVFLEDGQNKTNEELRYKLNKIDRNDYLLDYQKKMDNILNKQYQIEDKTKVIPIIINNYFLRIIKATPFLLKNYLSNKIFLKVKSKKEIYIFNIDFINQKIQICDKALFERNNVIIHVNSFVINDVCKKHHWNSLGVSKRLEVWMRPRNKRFFVFNLLCNVIEAKGFLPLRNILRLRFISIWIKRYREVFDLIFLAIETKILKKNPYIQK